jgi:hypothetical protein
MMPSDSTPQRRNKIERVLPESEVSTLGVMACPGSLAGGQTTPLADRKTTCGIEQPRNNGQHGRGHEEEPKDERHGPHSGRWVLGFAHFLTPYVGPY